MRFRTIVISLMVLLSMSLASCSPNPGKEGMEGGLDPDNPFANAPTKFTDISDKSDTELADIGENIIDDFATAISASGAPDQDTGFNADRTVYSKGGGQYAFSELTGKNGTKYWGTLEMEPVYLFDLIAKLADGSTYKIEYVNESGKITVNNKEVSYNPYSEE